MHAHKYRNALSGNNMRGNTVYSLYDGLGIYIYTILVGQYMSWINGYCVILCAIIITIVGPMTASICEVYVHCFIKSTKPHSYYLWSQPTVYIKQWLGQENCLYLSEPICIRDWGLCLIFFK